MLTKEEISNISRLNRMKPYQQEKHYVQTMLLNSIYSHITDELTFKGGTALFFCLGLARFSEDLDFTLKTDLDIRALVEKVHKDLEQLGLRNRVSKIEESEISCSFKFGVEGPLFTKEIERCFVKIDVSKREQVKNTEIREIKTSYPDVLPVTLVFMSPEEILAEKIRALLTRNYARDLYDLHFLLMNNTPVSAELIEQKISYYQKKFIKKEFVQKIQEKKDIWKAELEPLIMGTLPTFNEVKKTVLMKLNAVELKIEHKVLDEKRK